jgi:NitT/TauT family transport system substrate-binding protein
MRRAVLCLLLAMTVIAAGKPASTAQAQEIKEITLAQQFGAIFIPLMAMENMQLIEKQAAAQGLGDIKVNWAKMAGPSVMVDAIISATCTSPRRACPPLR